MRTRLDVKGYGVVVSGLCSNGKFERALEIRREMERRGLVVDKVVLTTLMDACFTGGDMKNGMDLREEMRKKRV